MHRACRVNQWTTLWLLKQWGKNDDKKRRLVKHARPRCDFYQYVYDSPKPQQKHGANHILIRVNLNIYVTEFETTARQNTLIDQMLREEYSTGLPSQIIIRSRVTIGNLRTTADNYVQEKTARAPTVNYFASLYSETIKLNRRNRVLSKPIKDL